MLNEKNIVRIVAFGPLIIIPLVFIALSFTIISSQNQYFKNNLQKLKVNTIELQKQKIKTRIDNLVNYLQYKKSIIKDELTSRVKERVDNAYTIANAIYNKNKNTKSEQEIKGLIKTALGSLTWNNNESFIWMINFKGRLLLAPQYLKHLEDTSIINTLGLNGKYTIKNEIKTCKEKKEGFIWDTYTKSDKNSSKQFEQLAFVKSLGFYDLYIGSAEYLDTAKEKANKSLLSTLSQLDLIHTQYLFIIKEDGTIILNTAEPSLVGKNAYTNSQAHIASIFQSIFTALSGKQNVFSTYSWKNPNSGLIETKVSYVKKVPNSDWVLGSGYYKSDIEKNILKESMVMHALYDLKLDNLVYISIILMILVFLVSYMLSLYIKKIFTNYQISINMKNSELMKVNDSLEEKVYKRTQELEDINNKLNYLAKTDSLTKVHNRYSIMEILSHEILRAHRTKNRLSMVMFDIDFFKNINDTYGHDAGDSVLRELASVTSGCLRNIDFLGRYGGEEFLILMPDTSATNALRIANRVQYSISKHSFAEAIQVTISLGLVQLRKNESIDEFLKRADELMYSSKENGRNRITIDSA